MNECLKGIKPYRAVLIAVLAFLMHGTRSDAASLVREVWLDVGGASVVDLTNDPRYPDNPTSTNLVTDFFESPTDIAENYGQRMHGYIIPPVTGNYTFWIATDDGGELWLSTDENPANKRKIAHVSGWTGVRQWTTEANQQSAPVFLEADKPYYVAALQKEAGGGDNLAVRWLRPDGVDQGPIPATYLYPWGIAFGAPKITAQPSHATAVEGQKATFTVRVDPLTPSTVVWRKNGGTISGATSATLSFGPVTMADNQTRFAAVLSNQFGTTNSAEAILTVTPDTTRPTVASVLNPGSRTLVRVTFSEAVEAGSATNPNNYRFDKGIAVTSAVLEAGNSVLLTTTALTYETSYTITISNIRDRAQNPNTILANSTVTFTAKEYAPFAIGNGSGNVVSVAGGFDVTGRSGQVGGSSDELQLGYQEITGDFDLRVRLGRADITDAFMKAGLMARESLSGNSAFAAVFASSPQLGCLFESRSSSGANSVAAAPTGGFPVNYPHMWLRLRRSGNSFTGFASFDGSNWTQLGNSSVTLPTTLYFGLALSSSNPGQTAFVEFRDLGPVVNPVVIPTPQMEKHGPTSRRTGLVLSEIMYYPKSRPDGKELEFIEIYNAGAIFEDLSGFQLTGEVNYTFPAGTIIPAGGFVIVAKAPQDVKSVYGLASVLGPWGGSLNNSGGIVTLLNEQGAVMQEVEYEPNAPWPASADGAGHSLVITRPSYGEGEVRAWSASSRIGGSPGNVDPVLVHPLSNVVINEFLARTVAPAEDFIELYNHNNVEVDLSGCWLSDDENTNKFRVPENTIVPARGHIAFRESQLGFSLGASGETIYFVNPEQTRVLDAVRFRGQETGVSSGRWPDGAPDIRRLATVTEGERNGGWRAPEVVISEIMYAPISGDEDEEYLELHNPGSQAISLSGWRLEGGIEFEFPQNATISAGGYLVVGRNASRLRANYSQLNEGNTFGNYVGSLRNSGERIALAKLDTIVSTNEIEQVLTNRIYIAVNEVTYSDGGAWGLWSDGGGSSLELIDPRSDNTQASNWADSDETAKASWTTVETTGLLDLGMSGFPPDALQITLQGGGEALIDDIQVLQGGSANRLSNPGFENGLTGWTVAGNHSSSTVASGGAASGTSALHIRAGGRGDTGPNSISAALSPVLTTGQSATIRAKVRWLKGWPEVLLRFRGSWLECAGRMQVPTNLGSPGLPNSRRINNAGPALYDVTHWPVLPQTGQSVTVTARVSDPDGVGAINLRYRSDPSGSLQTVAMRDDGLSGDAVANDGVYSGTIPSNAGTTVAFRIEATDAAGNAGKFPSDAPARECLVRWGHPVPFGTFSTYVILTTSATANQWSSGGAANNTYRNMTFIYSNGRVIYNGGVKDKGSPWHGGSGDYFMVTPSDEPFLGSTDLALCSTGNAGDEPTQQREQIAYWISRGMGGHYLNRRYVYVYVNGRKHRTISEDSEEPNGEYARSRVPERSDGELYKIEDWFEYGADGNRGNRDATLERFISGGTYKAARYRWAWRKRAIDTSANDFGTFFDLVTAVNSSASLYVAQVNQQVDVRNWMRVFALQRIVGNWDSYGMGRGKNGYIYKGEGIKWEMFPWDIDFVLGNGSNGPTDGLWGANDPTINRMYDTPEFRRVLWQAYLAAVEGPLLAENYNPQMDERYRILRANGINAAAPQPVKDYIDARRNHIVSQMNAANANAFSIASNNGNNFTTNKSVVKIAGTAPFSVFSIRVNGVVYPVSWSSERNWEITVPLTGSSNPLSFTGVDRFGQPIAGFTDTITVNYSGTLAKPEDWVVINEIMYNSADAGGSYIELHNRHGITPFDLSNYILNGVGYTFPDGSIIAPNGYLLIVRNAAAFSAVYGANVLINGEFPGDLDNGGEKLELVRPGATSEENVIVDQVRYNDKPPWSPSADGFGPSLQLIDPAQDNWRVANWGVTPTNASNRATPGAVNATRADLEAFPEVWINEIQANNTAGPVDGAGDRDPWIELYNSGSSAVDLSGLYLTDNYSALTQWQFPAGSQIGAGQFLVIWVDGEPAESTTSQLHANFRLAPSSGSVALSRVQLGQPAVMDYLNYTALGAGRSFGSYPNGRGVQRQPFDYPTPGAGNNPALKPATVMINEWMAGNSRTLVDPADNRYDDWIELFNAGTQPVDLSAYTITDNLLQPGKYTIPAGTVIEPGGYLLVWADENTTQNGLNADVHANFKLSADGEQIGLFAPDGSEVDSLTFGPQTSDVSEGRAIDGAEPPFVFFTAPTPRTANLSAGANQPPVLGAIADQTVDEGATVRFTATATDPDAGQTLTYSLSGVVPPGAEIDTTTGVFTWGPTEAHGPGTYPITLRAVDNGTPPRSASKVVTITVDEINRPPSLQAISDQTVNEGSLLTVQLAADDPDLPANQLVFSIESAPPGVSVDAASGELTWLPAESQGPGNYTISVRVTDSGTPALSSSASFRVAVNEVNNPPVFTQIEPRTVNEGDVVTIQLTASDPDNPPAAIRFSIVSGPPGATIDETSGRIDWQTSEATGPTTGIFVLRATEVSAEQLNTSQTFSVDVAELNQTPILRDIADIIASEGETVRFFAQGSDLDEPAQTLTYSLEPGAPAGAQINATTGEFGWTVPNDFGASTNQVTISVSDSGPGNLVASKSFRIIVSSRIRVVINEIMHSPSAANAAYVELQNLSVRTAQDLSGWRLVGKQMTFTFPAGSLLPPGAFLCVAQNRSAFAAAYGSALPVVGDWNNQLLTDGDTLSLLQPQTGGDPLVIDKVSFAGTAPWPLASGGTALQLIDSQQDNNRLANWRASASYTGPTNLILMTNTWRYNQAGENLGTTWRTASFSDSSWASGRALLYVESSALPAPKNTALSLGPTTFYFRARFNLPSRPVGAQLRLQTIVDDGAIYYLNGKEIMRQRMPAGAISYSTFASEVADNGRLEGPFLLPGDDLVEGENVLAVEVHQVNGTSTDVVFGCSLDLVGGTVLSKTPGTTNSVASTLPAFPPIYINELVTENVTGAQDGAGDRDPWVELYNSGSEDVSLTGFYLTDSYGALGRWAFPPSATIRAGERMVVWLDGEPGESTGAQYHTSFRAASSGSLGLVRTQNSELAIIDYVNYSPLGADAALASFPEGQLDDRKVIVPTPGTANSGTPPNRPPLFSAIPTQNAIEHTQWALVLQASDPDVPEQALAFELLLGPSGFKLSPDGLARWTPSETDGGATVQVKVRVSDSGTPSLSATNQFSIVVTEHNSAPALAAVPDRSVKAGELVNFTLTASDSDLPAQTLTFGIVKGPTGASIDPVTGEFSWTPTLAQANRTHDVTIYVRDDFATPETTQESFSVTVLAGAEPVQLSTAQSPDGSIVIQWPTRPGVTYRVLEASDVANPSWETVIQMTGDGSAASHARLPSGTRGFYRIVAE